MIELQIDTESYDLSSELRARIDDRIGGLDEFMDTLERGHVTVSWDGGPNEQTRIRAQLEGAGHRFEATDTDWEPSRAVDRTRDELEAQIHTARGKERDARDHGGPDSR
jgi:ribosome-associated translation inhibitor RaiA